MAKKVKQSEQKKNQASNVFLRSFPVLLSFVVISAIFLLYPFSQTQSESGPKINQVKPIPSPTPLIRSSIEFDAPVAIPLPNNNQPVPETSARGIIIVDPDSSSILYEKNADQALLPASTTKIMTALIALENYDMNQVVTVDREERTIGQTMNLVKGEQITIENLLYGTLVSSGNDAALALALAYPDGGYSGFVRAMNQKAQELHLNSTSFTNVSGVESYEHLSSARDLALLTKYALQNENFRQLISTQYKTVYDKTGKIQHRLTNTNKLLGRVQGMIGVKTGWTERAGECLVSATTRNGKTVIIVVLGSEDRFGETQQLTEWAFSNHIWQEVKEPRREV